MSHPGGCSCCADAFVDDGIFGSEDLNQYIVRLHSSLPRARVHVQSAFAEADHLSCRAIA